MNAVFKLAGTAVMALAIIWLLLNYVFPLAGGGLRVQQAMVQALEAAQGLDGQVLAKTISIRKGESLPAESLDTSTRSVNYRCTDAKQCCPLGGITSGCRLALDERLLSAQEDAAMPVHYRCQLEENIYLCTAYFGRGPAQLEWADLRAPREVELGKDPWPTVVLKVRNAGQTKAYDVVATAKVYRVSPEDGRENRALSSGPINRQTEEILPDEEAGFTLPLEIREAGAYQVVLEVRGVESGKVTKTFELKARGQAAMATCKAALPGEARLERGQCLQEYRCAGCAYDYECKLAWEGKLGEEIVDWSRDAVWIPAPPEKCA